MGARIVAPAHEPPESDLVALLARWNSGERAALDALLERVMPMLAAHARGRLGDALRQKEETGDVLHEAISDFLVNGPRFTVETPGQLIALLQKIVEHAIADRAKWFSRKRRDLHKERPLPSGTSVSIGAFGAGGPTPSGVAQQHEREAGVRLALELLPPLDQRLIVMRVYEDRPFAEIGKELGLTENNARMRLSRALKRLSKSVKALAEGTLAALGDEDPQQ
jgi:RNA polymerase sigma-70 factor (ECF subfamily)